jgi:hypothetical protein
MSSKHVQSQYLYLMRVEAAHPPAKPAKPVKPVAATDKRVKLEVDRPAPEPKQA